MLKNIQVESHAYCQWYNDPPVFNRCPHLNDNYSCKLYKKKLITGEAIDVWSGRDEFYVERCEECKQQK
jgi:hypothetical protein